MIKLVDILLEMGEGVINTYPYSPNWHIDKNEANMVVDKTFEDEFSNKINVGFMTAFNGVILGLDKEFNGISNIYVMSYDIKDKNTGNIYYGSEKLGGKMKSTHSHYLKIIYTVLKITKEFIETYSPTALVITNDTLFSSKEFAERKQEIYKQIVSKNIPSGYKMELSIQDSIIIRKKI